MIHGLFHTRKYSLLGFFSLIIAGCGMEPIVTKDYSAQYGEIYSKELARTTIAIKLDPIKVENPESLAFTATKIDEVKTGQFQQLMYEDDIADPQFHPFECLTYTAASPFIFAYSLATWENPFRLLSWECTHPVDSYTVLNDHTEELDKNDIIVGDQTEPYTGTLHISVGKREIMSQDFTENGKLIIDVKELTQANDGTPPTEIEAAIDSDFLTDRKVFDFNSLAWKDREDTEQIRPFNQEQLLAIYAPQAAGADIRQGVTAHWRQAAENPAAQIEHPNTGPGGRASAAGVKQAIADYQQQRVKQLRELELQQEALARLNVDQQAATLQILAQQAAAEQAAQNQQSAEASYCLQMTKNQLQPAAAGNGQNVYSLSMYNSCSDPVRAFLIPTAGNGQDGVVEPGGIRNFTQIGNPIIEYKGCNVKYNANRSCIGKPKAPGAY
ncbi:MAG: hypothetical protein ABSB19_07165 [Methylomonas sp.]|jgi:hypothetical protein